MPIYQLNELKTYLFTLLYLDDGSFSVIMRF